MSSERQHAEAVAREVITCRCGVASYGDVELTVCNHADFGHVADLIQRERADLLARAEAAELDLKVMREDRDALLQRPLTITLQDLRAKLAASEARVAELDGHVTRHYAVLEAVRRELGDGWMATDDLAERVKLTREAKDHWLKMVRERAIERDEAITARDAALTFAAGDNERADEYMAKWQAAIASAEKAEAAAGQMRAALELAKRYFADLVGDPDGHLWVEYCHSTEKTIAVALATDAGRDYQSPEQVAQACAAARDAALEEAAQVCVRLLGAATYTASTIRALKVTP